MKAIRFGFRILAVCGLLVGTTACEEITGIDDFTTVQPDGGSDAGTSTDAGSGDGGAGGRGADGAAGD
jgi:hypothetical protein